MTDVREVLDRDTPNWLASWRRFWARGGWWRAVVVAAGYYVLYQLGGLLFAPLARGVQPGSAVYVVILILLPIALGGVLLVAFALSVGWLKELFAAQPLGGRGWMWIAVAIVLIFNLLRFAALDYRAAGAVVPAWLLAGLAVGFAEEVLTRGLVVKLMRRAGRPEIAVALVSAAIFAALHAGNLLSGQPLVTTAIQILYTFAFGICMYLALRVTGRLVVPILLHASTDPSIFLLSSYPSSGPLAAVVSLGNFPVIFFGLAAIPFLRGRVPSAPSAEPSVAPSR